MVTWFAVSASFWQMKLKKVPQRLCKLSFRNAKLEHKEWEEKLTAYFLIIKLDL